MESNLANLLNDTKFENNSERMIFMALNVVRFRPALIIPVVNKVKESHELAKKVKYTKDLVKALQRAERLPPLRFDIQASQACLENNKTVCSLKEEIPTRGGNIVVYQSIVGPPYQIVCEEYTMCKFESESAAEFVALQLIKDWGNFTGSLESSPSPILNPEMTKVGISLQAHRKTVNLFQVLYVKAPIEEAVNERMLYSSFTGNELGVNGSLYSE